PLLPSEGDCRSAPAESHTAAGCAVDALTDAEGQSVRHPARPRSLGRGLVIYRDRAEGASQEVLLSSDKAAVFRDACFGCDTEPFVAGASTAAGGITLSRFRPLGQGAADAFSQGLHALYCRRAAGRFGHGRERVVAVHSALTLRKEGLPLHTLWVIDPALLALRVAASSAAFLKNRPLGALQPCVDLLELARIFDLNTEVLDAGSGASGADGEVHARLLQHPLGIVGLEHCRPSGEQMGGQTCALQQGNGSSKGGSRCDTRHDAPLARAALAAVRRPVGDAGAATQSRLPAPLQQFSVR